MNRYCLFLLSTLFLSAALYSKGELSLLGETAPKNNILINNRIVAKVNGKAISVVDLMKKMDLHFYREFPQYRTVPEARFEYYHMNWQHVLRELVEKELIIADAEENKIPASASDVRQEMEEVFGPNILKNLNNIGMSFDEAWQIVQNDILIQRMLYIRVHSKVIQLVTPQEVRKAYDGYIKSNVLPKAWDYRVISLRDKNPEVAAHAANFAYQQLTEKQLPIAELAASLKEQTGFAQTYQLTVSDEMHHDEKEISEPYRQVLETLSAGNYSSPAAQQSRGKGTMAFRIFFLKEFHPGGVPPYSEVAGKLKDELLQTAAAEETKLYLTRLRKHFDVQEMLPADFEPFKLY
jgi:hypothetical protein